MAANALEVYSKTAPALQMRAIARIALARRMTQTSLAADLELHASNVRRHFESKSPQENTIALYIRALGRNDAERELIRDYLHVLEGRFEISAGRKKVIDAFRLSEPSFREGMLSELIASIELIEDVELFPALQAYLRAEREMQLSLVPISPLEYSLIGRRLGLPAKVFADALKHYVDLEKYVEERPAGVDCLWLLWAHMRTPDSPFDDDDRHAILATAAGRLLMQGIDPKPMLHYVDRLRAHDAKHEAFLRE